MRFMLEMGFDIKEGRTGEYQAWLQEHEPELSKVCPPGIEYLGTFVAIYTSEKSAGGFKSYWRMDSYAAQDRFAEAMKEGGRFAELIEEATEFVDQRNDADRSNGFFKAVADAAIWGDV